MLSSLTVTQLSSNPIKAAAGIAAGITLGVGAIGCPAKAVIITVSGTAYDVHVKKTSYSADSAQFNSTNMPWWGNQVLATAFATQVLISNPFSPAYPNTGAPFTSPTSPLFAWSYAPASDTVASLGVYDNGGTPTIYSDSKAASSAIWYAYTPIPPSTAPAPLPILGAAAAFAWGRKIRARLKTSTL